MSHKKCNPVSQMISTTFHPLPTIKTVRKNDEIQIIYHIAHDMFRMHPLHKPLLIYKHQFDCLRYDFYIERTESGWNDMVYTYPVISKDNKPIYVIDGLIDAIKEEIENQPYISHMIEQRDMMCHLLDI